MILTEAKITQIVPAEVGTYPFQFICEDETIDREQWLEQNKDLLMEKLLEYGALLLRGFPIDNVEEFNESYKMICGEPMEYTFRTSPREEVSNKIYTSTSHPADQTIHMHTENSYSLAWNRLISFYCLVPPGEGGETPIADERRVIKRIKKEYLDKFKEKGILYVRNTLPGIGLDWRTIYQTNDKVVVEAFLKSKSIEFEWISDDHLRTKWRLPAFHKHPVTGDPVWFNHMYFGHKALYDPMVLDFIGEENLPFTTYYGDGTPVEDEAIQEFIQAYDECKIEFQWKHGDMLLLENMFFSHGRKPFKGDRTILVAMSHVVNC